MWYLLQVLQLEKESIRQHLIITRLIEENLRLRRHNSSPNSFSSELSEYNKISSDGIQEKCFCDVHYSHGQKNAIDLEKAQCSAVGDDKSCLLLQSISQVCSLLSSLLY